MRSWAIAAGVRLEPLALATLSLGAAAIHFAVISAHFAEYILFGVFFSLIGWFQALWALAYVIRPARWLGALAILANAATIATWAWAHLIGLPFGPNPGDVEPTTLADVIATLFELLLVGWLVARSTRGSVRIAVPPTDRVRTAGLILLIVAVAIATTIALAQGAG